MEFYDGDDKIGEADVLPSGFVLHICVASGDTFGIAWGAGCPNRRFGCGFVAPTAPTAPESFDRRMTHTDWVRWFGGVNAAHYAAGCEIPLQDRVADDLATHTDLEPEEIDVLAIRLAAYAMRQLMGTTYTREEWR